MEQEKQYLYPDGETPLMKYLTKQMRDTPVSGQMYLYLTDWEGYPARVEQEIAEPWQAYQDEVKRAVEAGEIEDPAKVAEREIAKVIERCHHPAPEKK